MKPPLAKQSSWFTVANAVWLAAYMLCMAGVVGGLVYARQAALANFASADAQANWDVYRQDMKKLADNPRSSVARRVPKSDEPPTLRLLRDHFGTVAILSVLLTTALFITFMVMLRGVLGAGTFVPNRDR